jgi:hypothetical protein
MSQNKSVAPFKKNGVSKTSTKIIGNKEFWESQVGPDHPNFQQHCSVKRPAEGTNNMRFFSDKEIRGDDNGDGLRDHPLFDGPGEVMAAARSCGKEQDYLAVYKQQSNFFYHNKWACLTGLHCRLVQFKIQAGARTATNTMMEGMTILDKSHIQMGIYEYRERILHQHVRYPILGYFSPSQRMARPKDGVVVVCTWHHSDWEKRAKEAAEKKKKKKAAATNGNRNDGHNGQQHATPKNKAGKRNRDDSADDEEAEDASADDEDDEDEEFQPKVGDQYTYDVQGLGVDANTVMGHFVVVAEVVAGPFDA